MVHSEKTKNALLWHDFQSLSSCTPVPHVPTDKWTYAMNIVIELFVVAVEAAHLASKCIIPRILLFNIYLTIVGQESVFSSTAHINHLDFACGALSAMAVFRSAIVKGGVYADTWFVLLSITVYYFIMGLTNMVGTLVVQALSARQRPGA